MKNKRTTKSLFISRSLENKVANEIGRRYWIMPTIVHFDIPSDNIERSKKFYSDLFGWKMDKWSGSSESMEYWLISTVDDKGNKAGGIGKRQSPQQQITNFIDVESVDEYSSKVERLGGKVISPKMADMSCFWISCPSGSVN